MRSYRRGFTIIELLVVICMISVLLAALLPMIGNSRDSALTAKCQNNMKNLALGVIARAQAHDKGEFPAAGFYRFVNPTEKDKNKRYGARRSWISNYGTIKSLNEGTASVYLGEVVHFSDGDDAVRMSVTNGFICNAAVASFVVYRCPAHVREYEKKNKGRLPGWSFMMNQEFGFNYGGKGKMPFFGSTINGQINVSTDSSAAMNSRGDREHSAKRGHDKVLLFAEIQGVEVDDSKHGITLKPATGGTETDAVLEYTRESMGFNHKLGKQRWCGNVAFADGHVDSVIMPTKMNRRDLTRYLCQGFDVPHDGSSYTPNENDKK